MNYKRMLNHSKTITIHCLPYFIQIFLPISFKTYIILLTLQATQNRQINYETKTTSMKHNPQLIISQQIKQFAAILQEPSADPCPNPGESTPHLSTWFLKDPLLCYHPSTPRSSERSLSFSFQRKSFRQLNEPDTQICSPVTGVTITFLNSHNITQKSDWK